MSAFSRLYRAYASQFNEDMELWRRLAQSAGGPILELGCADGRVSSRLHALGHTTTGIDLDFDLLRSAACGANHPRLLAADMRQLPFAPSFRLAICPSHTLAYFPDADLARILASLFGCLLPQAWLGFDLPAPIALSVVTDDLLDTFDDPVTGHPIQLSAVESEPIQHGQVTVDWRLDELLPDGQVIRHQQTRRYFLRSQERLRRLFGAAGFNSIEFWGDYSGRPFADDDSTLIAIARRP